MAETAIFLAHIFLFISIYFEVFLLMTFLEKKEDFKSKENNHFFPTVTIIVPSFNEEETLTKTVESLLSLNYPKEKLSLFLVDDGSVDSTWETMQRFRDLANVRLFKKENGGKHTALNLGIKESRSDIIGCLDADSYVDKEALRRMVTRFENKEISAVVPAIKVSNPRNIIEQIQSAEYTLSIFIRKVFSYIDSLYITPGPFSLFRKEVFESVGLYKKAHNTEDLEMALRIQLKKLRIDNAHDAYVYTKAPKTISSLYKQRVRWIHGFLENAKDYKHIFFKRGHGDLTFLILPLATFSIITALYFTFFALITTSFYFYDKAVFFETVGIRTFSINSNIDWFFLRTESLLILSLTLIAITMSFILVGKKIMNQRPLPSRDMFYFMLIYGFIAPFWLARSVYNAALSKKSSWR